MNAAQRVLQETGLAIPVVGLAKKNEEIYFPGSREPLTLPKDHRVLHLLQRLRDEAHRFAISYQRKQRAKRAKHSELDDISGIGEKRKMALLQAFGSVEAVKNASVDDLSRVKGMNRPAAERVFAHFHGAKI